MSEHPILATPRLRLRPVRADDAEALHAGYVDAAAMRYWSHGPHAELAQTREKLERSLDDPDWRLWAITPRDADRAIGTLSAHGTRQGGVIEIGYSLLRAHWGGGLAREALGALLDQLFRVEGQRRAFADIDPDNRPSRRLVEALGFRLEGVLREEWETHMGVRDAAIYGLLAREWDAARVSSSASTPA